MSKRSPGAAKQNPVLELIEAAAPRIALRFIRPTKSAWSAAHLSAYPGPIRAPGTNPGCTPVLTSIKDFADRRGLR